jgi:Arc/MetJ-type ribon-helix-helix transcriptional regulator
MTITLTREQMAWLEQRVAGGEFESVEDAVRLAVADLMALDTDDLEWARALIDEARDSLARGEGIPAKTVKAEIDAYLKSIGAR